MFCFKIWRVRKFLLKVWHVSKLFSGIWFLFCYPGSDWMTISSLNVSTNLFWRGELKDLACYRFSCQMYNWNLQHVNSSLNVWGKALWQQTIFTEVRDRTLWNMKCSRSAVFLKKYLCENKRKRFLFRISSIFSNVFVWATRKKQWKEADTYRASTQYWLRDVAEPQSWHSSKLSMLNRKSKLKTRVAQSIPEAVPEITEPSTHLQKLQN